ncbi:MAG TPA: sigma factor [Ktedonobacterales bacterium]|nr:sigma factor [Ktedonobacterales bacterium]
MDDQGAMAHDSSSSLRTTEQQRMADQLLIDTTQNSARPVADNAFERLLAPHERLLHRRLVARVAPDVMQADDLLNEIRWRLWRRLRRRDALMLRPPATFTNYLYRIATHVMIEYGKRHPGRLLPISLEESQERHPGWEPSSPDWTDGADAEALWRFHDQLLADAAASPTGHATPPGQRPAPRTPAQLALDYADDGRSIAYQALLWVHGPCRQSYLLFKLKGHSQKEIADFLGLALGTVSSHVATAHEQFRAFYALLLWEEEGASTAQIAKALLISSNQVETYVERGRYLRARNQRRSDQMGDR